MSGTALEVARQVLEIEIDGIRSVMNLLDETFERCVDTLYTLRGRIIVTGVGKSGIIGRKIAATLTSTGSPAIFVHPVEGLHGDVGIVSRDDVLLAISYSGETTEITSLTATIKKRGARVIALTGGYSSTLARMSDLSLDCRVPKEACPLNLAPTASTTATLVLGDTLAIALMVRRGFNEEDFRKHHPAGSLGERLGLKIRDLMFDFRAVPKVSEEASLDSIVRSIGGQNLGFTLVVGADKSLIGIITDGDLRRALEDGKEVGQLSAQDLMTRDPITVNEESTAAEALNIMERNLITALAVVGKDGKLVGITHLHDLLGRGEIRFTP
jgi:arabinose-5-phosphate isomerase